MLQLVAETLTLVVAQESGEKKGQFAFGRLWPVSEAAKSCLKYKSTSRFLFNSALSLV